ncbi:MAG: 50S ribosomal protein L5 [Phycisphaeraceae bacterium]|nr:50S ribosomal protein L5 [Phycisphaeraceae bacterium]
MMPRLKQTFREQVLDKLEQEFSVTNRMAMPCLDKIVLNVGVGKSLEGTKLNPKVREQVEQDLAKISGQKPVFIRARKSVSNFKVRAGYEVAAMVTLRGDRMWEFLDRLISLAIPRIKDFRGLSDKSFDGRGNYSFGVSEQGIFPEVDMANVQFVHGMHITMAFRNSNDQMSRAFLRELGFPFVREEDAKRN